MTDTATNPAVEAPDVELEPTGVAPADQDLGEGDASDDQPDDAGVDDDQPDDDGQDGDDDLDDFEIDGKTYRVPKALIKGHLRHQDYTVKTQEAARKAQEAEARAKAVAEQEEFLKTHAEAVKANLDDVAELKRIERDLAKYEAFDDWAGLEQEKPTEFTKHQLQWTRLQQQRRDLQDKIANAEKSIGLEARKRAEMARNTAIQDAAAVLKRDIKGWGPELVTKVADFAEKSFGYSREEFVDIATDPRNVKVLHLAMKGQEALNRERAAKRAEQSQRTKPAKEVGAGAPNARRTTDASGDGLSTEEWMRRERERLAKG